MKNIRQSTLKIIRVMMANMIYDLGNRMEAWIEKLKEMFKKDLGELKKNQ